jgi:hypothetical protein
MALSEEGFKFHLNNIEHYARMAKHYVYDKQLHDTAQNAVNTSKEILLSYFKKKEGSE